jgi:putative PIN family toxin of toxin-antitoxin system
MLRRVEQVRVVLDTSVLVAGLRSRRGASFQVLDAVAGQTVVPVVSVALFLEYEAVLKRLEQRQATGLTERDIEGVLAAVARAAAPVDVNFRWRPQLRDPADELVLEAAVNGQAEAIVTHNVRDFAPAAGAFGIRTVTPADLLKELQR